MLSLIRAILHQTCEPSSHAQRDMMLHMKARSGTCAQHATEVRISVTDTKTGSPAQVGPAQTEGLHRLDLPRLSPDNAVTTC